MSTLIDRDTPTLAAPRAPGLIALLREDVACVFLRDPAARTTWEVVTTYPGIHALLWHRIGHVLWTRGLRYPARFLSFFARMFTQIDIHPGATIGRRFFIDHGCGVVIGETAEIGDDVTLYHGVTLGGVSWNPGKRHPTLEDGVVVGAGAKILGPITVGSGARVGANSVVIQDVPAGDDLDHHLMPDPVGKAISCLLDRIAHLEKQLGILPEAADAPATGDCITCTETCDPGHVAVSLKRPTH